MSRHCFVLLLSLLVFSVSPATQPSPSSTDTVILITLDGARIEPIYDRTDLVSGTLRTVSRTLVEALVIVLLADFAWHVVRALIDRKLEGARSPGAPDTEEARRGARTRRNNFAWHPSTPAHPARAGAYPTPACAP